MGVILRLTDNAHLRAQGLDALDLVPRHKFGHADDAADARLLGGLREAAAVVARRNANDATGPFRGRKAQDRIGRAAQLEGTGDLQVL